MTEFSELLSSKLDRLVLDRTGLESRFDFTLDLARYIAEDGDKLDMIPGAVQKGPQKQLGLRLEAKKGPVQIVAVEHAEKVPAGN